MKTRNVKHKGLRRFLERGDATQLPPPYVEKIRNMLSFLSAMRRTEELSALPSWRAHQLSGDRRGVWSLTVSRNWRLTFEVHDTEICNLDFEDYH